MYRAAMDVRGSTISRAPESAPEDQELNDKERACMHSLSWIKPQMRRQWLSLKGTARDEPYMHGESQVLMDSCSLGLATGLLPQPTGFSASISAAAATASKNTHQGTTAIAASLQSQRCPFQISYSPDQTNATISRPVFGRAAPACKPSNSPLTIFYNGTVTVYDVPANKAEAIMTFASIAISTRKASLSPSSTFISMEIPTKPFAGATALQQPACKLTNGLPVARKQSLQRFIQKRKERMNNTKPYTDEDIVTNI